MPKIQMENLTGNFLRRMMIGPKRYFIRVSSLVHKWASHPLNSIFYFSSCYYQLHGCIMQKSRLLPRKQTPALQWATCNVMLSFAIYGCNLLWRTFGWHGCCITPNVTIKYSEAGGVSVMDTQPTVWRYLSITAGNPEPQETGASSHNVSAVRKQREMSSDAS